jgi:hypothetical protein
MSSAAQRQATPLYVLSPCGRWEALCASSVPDSVSWCRGHTVAPLRWRCPAVRLSISPLRVSAWVACLIGAAVSLGTGCLAEEQSVPVWPAD